MESSRGALKTEGDAESRPANSYILPRAVVLKSAELFQGAKEILIDHAGTYYRLMITKAGKLILNK